MEDLEKKRQAYLDAEISMENKDDIPEIVQGIIYSMVTTFIMDDITQYAEMVVGIDKPIKNIGHTMPAYFIGKKVDEIVRTQIKMVEPILTEIDAVLEKEGSVKLTKVHGLVNKYLNIDRYELSRIVSTAISMVRLNNHLSYEFPDANKDAASNIMEAFTDGGFAGLFSMGETPTEPAPKAKVVRPEWVDEEIKKDQEGGDNA